MLDLLLIEWVTKMKPSSNSVEDHPQLSHNRHPVDGALVHCGTNSKPHGLIIMKQGPEVRSDLLYLYLVAGCVLLCHLPTPKHSPQMPRQNHFVGPTCHVFSFLFELQFTGPDTVHQWSCSFWVSGYIFCLLCVFPCTNF